MELIEQEILTKNPSTYQKMIPISDYNYETKTTLDILVEKYGGYVNRYDDKIILYLNFSTSRFKENQMKIDDQKSKTEYFQTINKVVDRLTVLEQKVDKILEEQNNFVKDTNKSVFSYLNYFKQKENRSDIIYLADEIINHH